MRCYAVALVGLAGCFGAPPSIEGDTDSSGASTSASTTESSTPTSTPTSSTTTSDESSTAIAESSDDLIEPLAWRQIITLDTSAVDEPLYDVPMLVRLAPAYVDYASMAPDGSDVRFFLGNDDSIALPFEIESWHYDGVTNIWVRLPEVGPDVDGLEIVLGYGDSKPIPPPPPSDVWSAGYEAVWHLPSMFDSTGHDHQLAAVGTAPLPVQGHVGEALSFGESSEPLATPDARGFNFGDAAMVEVLLFQREHSPAGEHRTVVRKGLSYQLVSVHYVDMAPMFHVTLTGGGSAFAVAPVALTDAWTMLVGTLDRRSGIQTDICLWSGLDSAACQAGPESPILADPAPLEIGSALAGADIDEVRISSVLRPPSWVRLQTRSLESDFATFADPVPQ